MVADLSYLKDRLYDVDCCIASASKLINEYDEVIKNGADCFEFYLVLLRSQLIFEREMFIKKRENILDLISKAEIARKTAIRSIVTLFVLIIIVFLIVLIIIFFRGFYE